MILKIHFFSKNLLLLLFLFSFHSATAQEISPKYEMRATWITTIFGNDFPSKAGLKTDQQKRELIQLLDRLQSIGLNAIFFQIRPSADAFYESKKEPWSEWLTGEQGLSPYPFYDPLTFIVEECHKRNIELHAWLNPYRAIWNTDKMKIAESHIINQKPEWFISYGKKKLFNPGLPDVQKYLISVVMDVVRRYDVDGIHFDDYFYPYKEKDANFNDYRIYQIYSSNQMTLDDWRRENVNQLIHSLHDSIQSVKPYVKFGVSPFGVWRNKSDDPDKGSDTKAGQPSYDILYADILKWLEKGWIDYVAPQLYWSMGYKNADFEVLVPWWAENSFQKHLYIGHALYKVEDAETDERWKNLSEIPNQVRFGKKYEAVKGNIFFRAMNLSKNLKGLSDSLSSTFYKYPALVPPMYWKDSIAPIPIQELLVLKDEIGVSLQWNTPDKAADGDTAEYYVVYRFPDYEKIDMENPQYIFAIQKEKTFRDDSGAMGNNYHYIVTALDRLNNESKPIGVKVIRFAKDLEDSSMILTLPFNPKFKDTSEIKKK